jgi:RHS repeat-associated protein
MSIHSHLPYDQSTSHARIPAGGIDLIASIDSVSEAQFTASFFGSTKALHGEVAIPNAETTTHNHSNQQYSITAVTTSAGAIAERYAYSAYGEPTICDASGSVIASSTINNRYSYTGREWDATVGLHHFRARWISPKTGRFLGRDPVGYLDEAELYQYCDSKPHIQMDPSGEVPIVAIPTWIGRALLVRLGVVAAGATAGAIAASQSDVSNIFSNLPWGGVAGQQVLSTWNGSWNEKGIGLGRRPGSDVTPCNDGRSGTLVWLHSPWVGVWGDSDFSISLDFSTNGCDVTSLSLRKTMLSNSIRLQVLKVVIESVETKDLGYLEGCCDCDPKCVGVQIAIQEQRRGAIFTDTSSTNIFFSVCGDGSTAADDDSDGKLAPHPLPIQKMQ